ncbi:methylated-DNA--[protein]-cysteine S-methyltransferase [Haematomicrobium sanguinis]|uniref:methylated-DNA--[protein]-cysteine S-methyltransferase n=1 Tax=Haematomicrobium sanguinis TaxID=479106 RepID=UPI00047AC468|nr:methylated-DNA--[protein]-cysteine S-methyltransferase [Haematomicrobium sanguinis]
MNAEYFTLGTPDGPFTVIATEDGEVLASGWTDSVKELASGIHYTLSPVVLTEGAPRAEIRDAVDAYYAGDLDAVADIPVLQKSGPFRQHAWDILRQVGAGDTISYTEFAERSGNPKAVRAVASACANNSAALFVPCHRIVRTDGTLGGFRWGLPIKERLLKREAEIQAAG